MTTISSESRTGPLVDAGARQPATKPLPRGWLGVPVRAWIMCGSLAVIFVLLYWTSLRRLWAQTNPIDGTKEWAHAIFVPIVGLYYLYLNLDDLLKAKVKPVLGLDFTAARFISVFAVAAAGAVVWFVVPLLPGPFADYGQWFKMLGQAMVLLAAFGLILDWGLGSLLAGLLMYAYGIWPGSNDFVKDVGMMITVFGMVLTIGGWQIMKIAWFPCVFLLAIPPWPGLFYQKIAIPMQEIAAATGVIVMNICGMDVEKAGTVMQMFKDGKMYRALNVAEACSGLKSLMTFVSLGAAIAFLSPRPLWQKLFITISAVPIAIICNAMRVSGQGLLDHYVSQAWSNGFAHMFAGVVMLLPGFLMLLGIVWAMDKVFIEVDEASAAKPEGAA